MNNQDYKRIEAKSDIQLEYFKAIGDYPIVICSGPSGTGKTLGAFYIGYNLLRKGRIEKIIYIRSNNEFEGEQGLGYMPGDLGEKTSHLLAPVMDNMTKFLKKTDIEALIRSGKIEMVPVTHVRGRNFDNALVIVDEAQNTSSMGLLACITRMDKSSKYVIIGDTYQKDTSRYVDNGLAITKKRLEHMSDAYKEEHGLPMDKKEVCVIEFGAEDIQRHPILKKVVKAFYGYYPGGVVQ